METPTIVTVKDAVINISTEEKLTSREFETAFLRAGLDLQAAQKRIEDTQRAFTAHVEQMAQKYEVKGTHEYDLLSATFKRIEKAA